MLSDALLQHIEREFPHAFTPLQHEAAEALSRFVMSGARRPAFLLRGYAGTDEYADVALPTDGSTNYVLTVKNDVAGFYRKAAGFKVYNHKAYLNVPSTGAQALRLRFVDADGTTRIFGIMTQSSDERIYDLTGRRVRQAGKGVYIVNGKKVLR